MKKKAGVRLCWAGHALGVAVLLDGVLALAEGVPQLDRLVARARDDLAVVGREGDREHVLLVLVRAGEAAGRHAGVEVPQAERAVPRAREGELAVRRDRHVLNVVRVALERLARDAIVLAAVEVPHDDRLVARAGEEDVRLFDGRREAGDPVVVARERAAEDE